MLKPQIAYFQGMKYQLAEDYSAETGIMPPNGRAVSMAFIELSGAGRLTLKAGFAWDGASGPTIDTPDTMRGSAEYDAFYRLMRAMLLPITYRPLADTRLCHVLREDGMSPERAEIWHRALAEFGARNARPGHNEVQYAPA